MLGIKKKYIVSDEELEYIVMCEILKVFLGIDVDSYLELEVIEEVFIIG